MTERRIETKYGIEAYISDLGYICLKQDDPQATSEEDETIIVIDPRDVPTVIKWLEELLEERKNITLTDE